MDVSWIILSSFLFFLYVCSEDFCRIDNNVKNIVEHISRLEINRITLFVPDNKIMSSTSQHIKKEILKNFVTRVENPREASGKYKKSLNPDDPWLITSASNGLNVMLVDTGEDPESFSEELSLNVASLKYYTSPVGPRPKCLVIHVSTGFNQKIKKHLKQLWTEKYLHFTVIEIVRNKSQVRKLKSNCVMLNVRIHQYDPFNKIYTNQTYSMDITLFPNKPKDIDN